MSRTRRRRRRPSVRRQGGHRWMRVAVVGLAALVIFAGIGVLVFRAWLERYLESEDFERMVAGELGKATNARVEFTGLTRTGSSFYLDGFDLRGYEEADFQRVKGDRVRVNLNWRGIRRGVWDLPDVDIDRLHVRVAEERLDGGVHMAEENAGTGSSWLTGFLPDRVDVGQVNVDRFSLDVLKDGREMRLAESRVTVKPDVSAGTARFVGTGGEFTLREGEAAAREQVQAFTVSSFTARMADGAVFIDDADLGYLGDSRMTVRGEIGAEGDTDLRLNLTNLDVTEVVDEDWKSRLLGRLRMESQVRGGGAGRGGTVQSGTVSISDGVVVGFPVLDRIASYTRIDRFRRLVLDEARADFREQDGVLRVTDLRVKSADLLRLKGSFEVRDGEIQGVFDVGVAPETLRWVVGAEGRVFERRSDSAEEAGYLWTTMTVSGPLDSPREDLSSRLLAAAGGAAVEGALETGREAAESAGEAVREVPGIGRDLFDGGRDLLEGGLEESRDLLPLF